MQRIIILTERKATEATRRAAAVQAVVPLLYDYAREYGGRFLLFGSAARGQMKFHSDVDLLLMRLAPHGTSRETPAGTADWKLICCPLMAARQRSWATSRPT